MNTDTEALRQMLQPLLKAIEHPDLGLDWTLPWKVVPCDGKPIIASNRGGNLFRGYIATWQEAELIVAVVNALPDILAALDTSASQQQRDLFDAGFAACWSEMFVANKEKPAFQLTDNVFDRAWEIYLATREGPSA